ncbi:hypothetical protein SVA_1084 [Sulfurifustis variabilis]|uniref:DUF3301 domain-containing protein n=1 Tax=Sulfurifustis variabilis TaxID=1675686 RepID=A0A1B4V2C6_9GAMM|nr:DUF3301 domain-containing protein [Sulfurifustis variabilis]BAU47663.1 hypothetical protein SVA_1084 [Sulfurifustis variabilis]
MIELGLILFIALALALWVDGRRVQEIGVRAARRECERAGMQFLDETVALGRLALRRDADGRIRLERAYHFEYGTPSGDRERGRVVVLGSRLTALELEHRFVHLQ